MDAPPNNSTFETPDDFGENPNGVARRWKLELKLAETRENDWRKQASEAYDSYTPNNPRKNSFNILLPNTETLRHAVYNSPPEPQCKRRYSDEDPLGFKVGTVMTRALEFTLDCTDFDTSAKDVVLSMLLAGRGVLWERYIPTIDQHQEGDELAEEVTWEQVRSEFVQYNDFRVLCAAKTWGEVTAIARRHHLNRQDLIEKFGEEIGNKITLDDAKDDEIRKSEDQDIFKTAEIWEIWDKETKNVLFITNGLATPCKVEKDPLKLEGFWPTPKPLYAIENNSTMIPSTPYSQYKPQALELNRISNRINNLIDTLRVRGIYDAALSELSNLMKLGDDQFIPAQNAAALIERGGLDKAIWMMPIDTAAMVLKELYAQREATKQVIYELTGISDIMRAATDPKETFGAQQIKTQWGTQRLQKMQDEVQRYLRDTIRIKAEIISQRFSMETLEAMTLVQLPHQEEVQQQQQQAIMQYQQAAQQAMMQQQPPPPPPQLPPPPITWEDVVKMMQDDSLRSYHIDIETDSTIAATQNSDMSGLREAISGVTEIISGFGPAVQAGAIPIEAVKAIIGVVLRRARMGSAVEEAMDKIKPPNPQMDPEKMKADAAQKEQEMKQQQEQQKLQQEMQIEQAKMQMQMQIEQAKVEANMAKEQAQAQGDQVREQARLDADNQIEQFRAQMTIEAEQEKASFQIQIDHIKRQHELETLALQNQLEQYKHDGGLNNDMEKARLDSATKIAVAEINAQSKLDQSLVSAEQAANNNVNKNL